MYTVIEAAPLHMKERAGKNMNYVNEENGQMRCGQIDWHSFLAIWRSMHTWNGWKNPRSGQSRRGWTDKNRYLVLLRKMTRYALIPHQIYTSVTQLNGKLPPSIHDARLSSPRPLLSNDALKLYERCSLPLVQIVKAYTKAYCNICHQHNIAFGKGLVSCTWPFCAQGQSQLCL